MNYAEEIKNKIYAEESANPVKAVIYARVSTDNDSQKDSCDNQVAMAKNFIENHKNLSLIGTYFDDDISGKNDYNRPDYNAMIEQIKAGKVDLIITKALSRLNRDQLNSLQLTSLLIEHNATVLTLEDGQTHDFEDMGTELLHSLSFAIDAQYVKRQSINGRKTQELRCKRKELSAKDISFGYKWIKDKKVIQIDDDKADYVNFIFEEYVYRSGIPSGIKRKLDKMGLSLSERTITNILQDERYIGNFYINKRTSKLGTGKSKSIRIPLPKEQWILVERPDLQIIDNDLFDMAQRIRKNRQTIYAKPDKDIVRSNFQGTHTFSGKIFCSCCGKPFHFDYADRKKKIPVYRIKSHSDCADPAGRIGEKELELITQKALQEAIESQGQICEQLEQVLFECLEASQNHTGTIDQKKKQKVTKENQIDSLIETLSEGGLSDAAKNRIKSKINAIEDDIAELNDSIQEMEAIKFDSSYIQDKIKSIHNAISELRKFSNINRERVLNYIDRIIIHGNNDIDIILKSGKTITITQEVIEMQHRNNSNREDKIGVGKLGIQGVPY